MAKVAMTCYGKTLSVNIIFYFYIFYIYFLVLSFLLQISLGDNLTLIVPDVPYSSAPNQASCKFQTIKHGSLIRESNSGPPDHRPKGIEPLHHRRPMNSLL